MDELIGKYAYKTRGLYAGLVGKIEKDDTELGTYKLVYKRWGSSGFVSAKDIVIYTGEVNED